MSTFSIRKSFDSTLHQQWIEHRMPVLSFYNDYSFIRDIDPVKLASNTLENLKHADEIWQSSICAFFIKHLEWDTKYFGVKTFKIIGCLFGPGDANNIFEDTRLFVEEFQQHYQGCKFFAEIPSEDFALLQSLTFAGLRLVEGRLIHYKYPLQFTDKIAYRKATHMDAENLGLVAAKMRNSADRFHSDLLFDDVIADQYLYTYAKACAEGFTDVVVIPDEPEVPSDAFIAINYRKNDREWNMWKPAQIVLAAVDSEKNKGWYKKLIQASINHVLEEGATSLYNTTQITNKSVIHTLESLGFKLGCAKIVLSN